MLFIAVDVMNELLRVCPRSLDLARRSHGDKLLWPLALMYWYGKVGIDFGQTVYIEDDPLRAIHSISVQMLGDASKQAASHSVWEVEVLVY